MIKRIEFVTRRDTTGPDEFLDRWPAAVACWADAPPAARPTRVAACRVLHGVAGTDPRYDGVELVWCDDAEHLDRCEHWLASGAGDRRRAEYAAIVDPRRGHVVVADESIGRGADWLAARWTDGGERLKHMAIARRAAGLSPAEFSARWRERAGKVGRGAGPAITIPSEARGLAYVQNHPRPSDDPAYDAINEVYVADLAGLRARIDWFAENMGDGDADLVSRHWFLAARETVIPIP